MKQIKPIEWLRGLAAISVTQMHLFCAFNFFGNEDQIFQKYLFPISISGRSGVAMFFVISGYIIPYSMYNNNYKLFKIAKFLLKRFTRLEPPYLISILFTLFVLSLMGYLHISAYTIDWTSIALHLGYLNVFFHKGWIQGVYWTLAIEFQYYLIIAFLFPLIMIANTLARIGILTGVVLVFKLVGSLLPHDTFIFEFIEFFMLGIVLFLYQIQKLSKHLSWIFITSLLIMSWFIHHKSNTLYAFFTVYMIYINFDIRSKLLYFLGKISYSLYLFHWVVGVEILRRIYSHIRPVSTEIEKIGFVLFSNVACIAFAYCMYLFIERSSIKWSKDIKY